MSYKLVCRALAFYTRGIKGTIVFTYLYFILQKPGSIPCMDIVS